MRKKYYFISFLLGIIYLTVYLIILHINNWSYRSFAVIDLIFLIVSFGFLVQFIIKDAIDERRIRNGKPPIGRTEIEHNPFVYLLSLIIFYSIFVFPHSWPVKLVLAITCIIDGTWDIFQDIRSHSLR